MIYLLKTSINFLSVLITFYLFGYLKSPTNCMHKGPLRLPFASTREVLFCLPPTAASAESSHHRPPPSRVLVL